MVPFPAPVFPGPAWTLLAACPASTWFPSVWPDASVKELRRTEAILRERAAIPEEILNARRFKDVYITPKEAVIYGLVHAVREFVLPESEEIVQI